MAASDAEHPERRHKDKEKSRSKDKERRHKDDDGHKSKKRHHKRDEQKGEDRKRHKKRHRRDDDASLKVVDDNDEGDVWVEKDISQDGMHPLATDIPTADSLALKSTTTASDVPLPPSLHTETTLKRDEWMFPPSEPPQASQASSSGKVMAMTEQSFTEDYGDEEVDKRTLSGGIDFFSSLGTEKRKKIREDKPDPEKLKISSRELNVQLKEGKSLDEYTTVAPKPTAPGGPGSTWRMSKLKRTYEIAEEEGRTVEEVAIERYGSMEEFNEARSERQWLDDRDGRRALRGGRDSHGRGREHQRDDGERKWNEGEKRWMYSDMGGPSRPDSRSSFRRPGGTDESTPSTPRGAGSGSKTTPASERPPTNKRLDSLRHTNPSSSQPSTPIPRVMTPQIPQKSRALSPSSLNKLQARVLRARLMGGADADALEMEYNEAVANAGSGSGGGGDSSGDKKVEVLPSLDVRGRLYDVGQGRDDGTILPGNRKKKEKVETRDPKTGDLVRYNADDDTTTLGEMLRQERFGAGMADQKDMDAELARAIMGDGKFEDDLEYMDDNAEKLGRKKMRTDAMKRQFAINDYARTQKALASCMHCYGEDDSPPKAAIIAMGTRAYLACPLFEELVEGHCYIVPIQHHLSSLEADDDVWDEIRNFMKCLMRMFAEEDKGVMFYETVISLKHQKHTYIECVPVPWEQFEDLPAYFKESILASESEWSQHKKVIDFSARPGGFRRAMVPNLPYFMVQWDYKGEKGYGHVIEGVGDDAGGGDGDGAVDEGDKGGGEFPRYFAAEIIGNVMELEPRKWRRPKRVDLRQNKARADRFNQKYAKHDWTKMIGKA
ncbi:hypothetical protein BOTBODRAFT_113169 [Botryobasidium botryosum FD-172 SS1]|uniref:Cwf19-like C-terminal domain-containing protein n=1 Tax=Botryobasidium botryosum (strain FD-172 SS1) TaxID=930990 RepID=A0A067MLA4_BOTB1|nr:hypothetical protein BOTBODRAFT_113169 [Botryobasidium botryosum FD-172 SS1]